jgi:site-specific DNA-cytosine methylase
MTILSLCSGIGGLELGIEHATDAEVVCQAESDPYARSVLARHWPDAVQVDNVAKIGSEWKGVDIVCAGLPCQPHSLAGLRGGSDDERDLWPEGNRILQVVQPKVFILENVPGLLTSRTDNSDERTKGLFFLRILRDCQAAGYLVRWDHCPASAVGALHRRDRIFLVATRSNEGWPAMSQLPIQERLFGGPPAVEWPRAGAWSGHAYESVPLWPLPDGEFWPTLSARDWKSGKHGPMTEARNNSRPCNEVAWKAMGKPNDTPNLCPTWCESFMGFPVGWTLPEGPNLRGAKVLPPDPNPRLVRGQSRDRIRCLGNSVYPPAAEAVTRALVHLSS